MKIRHCELKVLRSDIEAVLTETYAVYSEIKAVVTMKLRHCELKTLCTVKLGYMKTVENCQPLSLTTPYSGRKFEQICLPSCSIVYHCSQKQ